MLIELEGKRTIIIRIFVAKNEVAASAQKGKFNFYLQRAITKIFVKKHRYMECGQSLALERWSKRVRGREADERERERVSVCVCVCIYTCVHECVKIGGNMVAKND